jgi:hypothetical protein
MLGIEVNTNIENLILFSQIFKIILIGVIYSNF